MKGFEKIDSKFVIRVLVREKTKLMVQNDEFYSRLEKFAFQKFSHDESIEPMNEIAIANLKKLLTK